MDKAMDDALLDRIESAAKGNVPELPGAFAHPGDTLALVNEVRRLRAMLAVPQSKPALRAGNPSDLERMATAGRAILDAAQRQLDDLAQKTGTTFLERPAPVVHYSPYGRWQGLGKYDCGAPHSEPYTTACAQVACEACKRASPGLWPEYATEKST